MPRRTLIVLITSLASLMVGGLSAADRTSGPQLGGSLARVRTEQQDEIPNARLLIYQRARRIADARAAKLEAYEAMGYMPTRPLVYYSPWGDLNPGVYRPWVAYYRLPPGQW